MSELMPQRKLAAILAADVVGFSAKMSDKETQTLRNLKAVRAIVDEVIVSHHGRVFNTAGDSVLAEFPSAIDAVMAAVEFQKNLAQRNEIVSSEDQMELRVGLNLGDVIVEGDNLYGEGVNVAARLEALAEQGGICISASIHREVRKKLEGISFDSRGDQSLKNIPDPVSVFDIRAQPVETNERAFVANHTKSGEVSAKKHADIKKPSIAVLAFENMSGDKEQEYFADGIAEDIITGLSRIKSLFVIARNSSFVFKGGAVDIREVAQKLRVRYVLEGSVRKSGSRLRITAQLIEAENGTHVWAEKFDGAVDDVFDVQDTITEAVVKFLEPHIERAEIERARRIPPENLDAYDLVLRATPLFFPPMLEHLDEAMGYLKEAIAFDPKYGRAHAMLAWAYEIRVNRNVGGQDDINSSVFHAAEALKNSGDDAQALAIAAFATLVVGKDYPAASRAIRRALEVNPSNAIALFNGAWIEGASGDCSLAVRYADEGIKVSPVDPLAFHSYLGKAFAEVRIKRGDLAIASMDSAIERAPEFSMLYFFQAAFLAKNHGIERAIDIGKRGLRLHPLFQIRGFDSFKGVISADLYNVITDGLKLARLPP